MSRALASSALHSAALIIAGRPFDDQNDDPADETPPPVLIKVAASVGQSGGLRVVAM